MDLDIDSICSVDDGVEQVLISFRQCLSNSERKGTPSRPEGRPRRSVLAIVGSVTARATDVVAFAAAGSLAAVVEPPCGDADDDQVS